MLEPDDKKYLDDLVAAAVATTSQRFTKIDWRLQKIEGQLRILTELVAPKEPVVPGESLLDTIKRMMEEALEQEEPASPDADA